ncbi:MAG: SIMPL domain-containing protein [Hyphomonadaceae bacterium]|nr:SIMPL domain-containing protein [Hyphomonadaceae bacterium]
MKIQSKPGLMAGLSAASLLALAACGGGGTTTEAPAGAPTEPSAASVPSPTVTPNADPIATTHPNSIQPETTLSISAEGSVNREPDIAFLNAGVQTQGETAQAAMSANATAMNGVFDALAAANVDRTDMQTSNFSLQPQYDYSNRQSGQPPRLTGYQASNQLTVRVRDLDTLGETMDALVSAGGNTFSGLRFALEDDRAAKNAARDIAMKEAIARAELYAAASGYEVARVVTISESGGFSPQPMAMMAESRSMDRATPVATGEVGYSVTVNVTFELRKPAE